MTSSSTWIDNQYLETVLRLNENDADLHVISSVATNAVPKGDNYGSILMRVAVEYKRGDAGETRKRSLIVKTLPVGEMMQKWISETGIFERESHIYHVALPRMYRLIEERTGHAREHLGTRALVTDRADTIILQDLCASGYKMANRREGLDLEHSKLAIATLAKLHAVSMALHAVEPATMEYYRESFYVEEKRKFLTDFFETSFTSLAAEVASWPGYERYADKVAKVSSTSVDRSIELARNEEGAWRVLNHGDFWTNNMLFKYDGARVAKVKMVDFQLVRFASPALDILYFLNTSPSQHIWEEHRETLIDEYHRALNRTLKLLKCENLTASREKLDRELTDKAYFAVITSCLLCMILAEPCDAPDMSLLNEQDNGEGRMIESMSKIFAGERFKHAFQRRLPVFEAQGLI